MINIILFLGISSRGGTMSLNTIEEDSLIKGEDGMVGNLETRVQGLSLPICKIDRNLMVTS